ncbi:MAG: WbuC family cupin fold metalloprotein [Verrucomicrobia bacterium]|nr:WbuC family cupin fold metalloprotein [Verrucomicrobiota bacterium]
MIKINRKLIDGVIARAKESPRLRMNHNFHAALDDPVQRLLNALEPWSYIRPHKHDTKEESFVLLRGTVLAVVFNDDGTIRDHCILSAANGNLGVELEENSFHMLTALESESVVFEIKEGPFVPHTEASSAPWAPPDGSPDAPAFLSMIFGLLGVFPKTQP